MFKYEDAFSRNIGWVTEEEQALLRTKKVAVAGAGGVGSLHMLTLARLGIQHMHISDFDEYEVHNFNRQFGALMSTVGKAKVSTMNTMIRDINPDAAVKEFDGGVDEGNVDAFLEGVDIYVDSLDFFALHARKLLFSKCYEKNIPVVTAAPLGMGCALLCFLPGRMTFEQYFRFNDKATEEDQLIQFLIGLSPAMLQRNYLVDTSTVNFKKQKGPSTVMAVNLCAGMAETYVLKILLNRGNILAAPYGIHFDAYRNVLKKTWRPFGNRGLTSRLMFNIAKKAVQ
ncbi:ThiF family adenylyltransferase [Alteromonas sp. S167]|uniref:ThiF family adenylyltransferase n=1 Tax=Alteromonas sp. S167 TaxID=3117402 RepID=UPI002FE34FF1